MADYTITISNYIYTSGPDLTIPSLWGTMVWGDNWNYTSYGTIKDIEVLRDNSISADSTVGFDYEKLIEELITPDSAQVKDVVKFTSETITVESETTEETLQDGSGYYYVFRRPSEDAEDRTNPSWTAVAEDTESWTSGAAASTSWSEV